MLTFEPVVGHFDDVVPPVGLLPVQLRQLLRDFIYSILMISIVIPNKNIIIIIIDININDSVCVVVISG